MQSINVAIDFPRRGVRPIDTKPRSGVVWHGRVRRAEKRRHSHILPVSKSHTHWHVPLASHYTEFNWKVCHQLGCFELLFFHLDIFTWFAYFQVDGIGSNELTKLFNFCRIDRFVGISASVGSMKTKLTTSFSGVFHESPINRCVSIWTKIVFLSPKKSWFSRNAFIPSSHFLNKKNAQHGHRWRGEEGNI